MKRFPRNLRVPPRWRWVFWPIVAIGSAGTATVLWLQEEASAFAECAPLAALPGLAALLYWFNHYIFEATKPRREEPPDKTTPPDKTQ